MYHPHPSEGFPGAVFPGPPTAETKMLGFCAPSGQLPESLWLMTGLTASRPSALLKLLLPSLPQGRGAPARERPAEPPV